MIINQKQYELFKTECLNWINKFELNNWQTNFKNENLEDNIIGANTATDISGYVCTITLNTEVLCDITDEDIKRFAKHEIIHLLLARLSEEGRARYINENEMNEAEEELVIKLLNII